MIDLHAAADGQRNTERRLRHLPADWLRADPRDGHITAHRNAMLGAFASSTLFLISYLVYHANVGSRPFAGQGSIRIVYFAILISHVILAAAILPMAISTLSRGLRGRYADHKRIAKWTFPTWMYVSVTGVIVYLMLYRM